MMLSYNYRAVVVNVIDGDTVDMVIDLGFRMTTEQRVRLLGINAPEMRGDSAMQGVVSKKYLSDRILGKEVVVITAKADSFGRYLGTIFIDGVDVNEEMITKGYAVTYKK